MTIHRYLNQGGFGGNYTMWHLLQALKDAGWKVIESGSGTGGKYSETGSVGTISQVSGDTWQITDSGTTGSTGSISNVSGDTWQITDTSSFAAGMVGDTVTVTNGEAGNNGSFAITAADSDHVEFINASGQIEGPDTFDWKVTVFEAAMDGNFVTISNANNAANDGIFEISAADEDHIEYVNASAVAEGPDTFDWKITGDVFDASDNPKIGSAVADLGQPGWADEHFGGSRMWFRVQDPGGTKEFLFQRGAGSADSDDDEWWVGYSRSAKFVGGTADEDTSPDATDEQTVSSSGSKATPTGIHAVGTVATVVHVAADDTPSSSGCYGFICLELVATNDVSVFLIADDLQNAAAGDVDAYSLSHMDNALTESILWSNTQANNKVWVDAGGAQEAWKNGVCMVYRDGQSNAYHDAGKTSKYDGKERPMPIPVVEATVGGYLGMSRWLNWAAVARDYPNSGDSFNLLYVDEVIILDLWDGATTPQAS